MRITFNVLNCGLENNGGSITIIDSANTLVDMGHEVTIVDNQDIRYTWGGLKAEHRIIKGKADLPDADAVISTGFATVRKMLHFPDRCGKKFHWIRGWETWNYPEWYIEKTLLCYPVTRLVNGIQLQQKLAGLGIESYLVRPGYDFGKFSCLNARKDNDQVILGGLYSNGKKRRGKRTGWILKAVKRLKKNHNVKLWMFGQEANPGIGVIDRYFKEPSAWLKNEIYNACDIWLAPTELEGLHMPPAEAMLTECPVVGTNAELSGMVDYLGHNKTGRVTDNGLESFVSHAEALIKSKCLRRRLGKQARRTVLALGDRKTNMERMVEVVGNV